jgi:UDP-N-acetylglucosamine 2-epimerase (non-hydrolysing)
MKDSPALDGKTSPMNIYTEVRQRPAWAVWSNTMSEEPQIGPKVMTVFGTRPEIIKLAPVIAALEKHAGGLRVVNVASAQHTDLLYPFAKRFGVRFDHDLQAMRPGQNPAQLAARVLESLAPILAEEKPHLVLVQGDTTTALAGALAAFYADCRVGHVEAGLRSGAARNPFPEEMNRRLISQMATHHFAATEDNRASLLAEGVAAENIHVTGNPVVDALQSMIHSLKPSSVAEKILAKTEGRRRVVLTTHRRESFGATMLDNLAALRCFIERRPDTALIFPVHPNPAVTAAADEMLTGHPRIHLLEPLGYEDFLSLLAASWLIVSDSGGVQEEAPSLGKPLLVLRENTERPEAIKAGVAKLVGGNPKRLLELLNEAAEPGSWAENLNQVENPFGRGDAGTRIAGIIARELGVNAQAQVRARQPHYAPLRLVAPAKRRRAG